MAAVANIVIADGATPTPVNHTFVPVEATGTRVTWEEQTVAATLEGRRRITAVLQRAGSGKTESKVKISIYDPILANITNSTVTGVEPAPTVAYVPRMHAEFYVPTRVTASDTNNLTAFVDNLFGLAVIKDVIKTLSLPY